MNNNSFGKQLIISEERYNHILKKDAWHEMEIKAIFKTDSSIYELLRAAIAARTLTPFAYADIGEGYMYVFRSQDVIEWGRLKGYSIPDEYINQVPVKSSKIDKESKKHDIRRSIATAWYESNKDKVKIHAMTNAEILDLIIMFDKDFGYDGGLNWINRNGSKIWGKKEPGLKSKKQKQ